MTCRVDVCLYRRSHTSGNKGWKAGKMHTTSSKGSLVLTDKQLQAEGGETLKLRPERVELLVEQEHTGPRPGSLKSHHCSASTVWARLTLKGCLRSVWWPEIIILSSLFLLQSPAAGEEEHHCCLHHQAPLGGGVMCWGTVLTCSWEEGLVWSLPALSESWNTENMLLLLGHRTRDKEAELKVEPYKYYI